MENILTERCALTRLCETDIEELTKLYANEKVRKYLGGTLSADKAAERLLASIDAADEYNFVIKLSATCDVIGLLTVAPHHDTKDMEISYMILPEHWVKGYATETIKALLDFCKNELILTRIVSETQTANKSSCQLLKKLGYKVERELWRFGARQALYVLELKRFLQ